MSSRSSNNKTPTISLPFYNSPRPTPRSHSARRNKTRYMALGLVIFLSLVTFFAFGRATPLIRKSSRWDHVAQNAAIFQSNLEAITEIYRGTNEQVVAQQDINHLVVVTGHAILLDKFNYLEDEAWVL